MKREIESEIYKKEQLTPKTARLTGPLYLIWTLTVVLRATMQDTSTANTSPTSRTFCATSIKQKP